MGAYDDASEEGDWACASELSSSLFVMDKILCAQHVLRTHVVTIYRSNHDSLFFFFFL